MRKITKKFFVLLSLVLVLIAKFQISAYADEKLDEVTNYEIKVNVREDGTLDIRYDVTWHVLSDKKGKEPVTWVKIGIPNKYCEEVNPITNNIKSAKYYSDSGDFVRVDFTKKYYEGEIFNFSFTVHQSYMYMLEDNAIKYSFTAGWFENIEVKKITINWNRNWVEESTATEVSNDGKYLVWTTTNLPEGEHFSTSVRYPKDTFATDESKQFEERSSDDDTIKIIAIIAVIFAVVVFLVIVLDDGYGGGSGFGGGYHSSTFISSCARSSCACASHCACACACAGGGRAGCSAKDFYDGRTKVNSGVKDGISITIFEKVIEEDLKGTNN